PPGGAGGPHAPAELVLGDADEPYPHPGAAGEGGGELALHGHPVGEVLLRPDRDRVAVLGLPAACGGEHGRDGRRERGAESFRHASPRTRRPRHEYPPWETHGTE